MAGTTIKEKLQRRALVGRKVVNIYQPRQEVYKLLIPEPQNNEDHRLKMSGAAKMIAQIKKDGFKGHVIGIIQKDRKDFDLVRV